MSSFGFFSNNSSDKLFIVPSSCSVFGVYRYVILFNFSFASSGVIPSLATNISTILFGLNVSSQAAQNVIDYFGS